MTARCTPVPASTSTQHCVVDCRKVCTRKSASRHLSVDRRLSPPRPLPLSVAYLSSRFGRSASIGSNSEFMISVFYSLTLPLIFVLIVVLLYIFSVVNWLWHLIPVLRKVK